MANAIVGLMKKARTQRDRYLNAAKDLARAPGVAKKVMTFEPANKGFDYALQKSSSDKAAAARKRARGGYGR